MICAKLYTISHSELNGAKAAIKLNENKSLKLSKVKDTVMNKEQISKTGRLR